MAFVWFPLKEMYPGNVTLAQTYLESQVTGGVVSNYSLALVAYALVLANSRLADTALSELTRRADHTGTSLKLFSCFMLRKVQFLLSYLSIKVEYTIYTCSHSEKFILYQF